MEERTDPLTDQTDEDVNVKITFSRKDDFKNFFRTCWKGIFLILWPAVCSPIALVNPSPPYFCLFTVAVMAGFWVTEAIPVCVTAMIPIALYPLFRIMGTNEVCMEYFKAVNGTFIAGIFLALTLEYCNLHMRIALLMIKCIGSSLRRITFALALITGLTSMWVSNTAATAMMCPIILTTLTQLQSIGVLTVFYKLHEDEPENELNKKASNITAGFFLTICYSATIGGTGTYIGTPTNLTFRGVHEERFGAENCISFALFMAVTFPIMFISLILTWLWLQFVFFGLFRYISEFRVQCVQSHMRQLFVRVFDFRPRSKVGQQLRAANARKEIIASVINEEYNNLDRIKWHEIWVLIFFVSSIVLLVTMKPGFMPGWGSSIAGEIVLKDATPLVGLVVIMFCIPDKPICVRVCSKDLGKRVKSPRGGLIIWNYLHAKTPWSLLFLIGGGLAMARGAIESKASNIIGNALKKLDQLPSELVILLCCLVSSLFTQITENLPVANIMLPVLNEMAVAMKIHPLKFTYPAAICSSFAFLLPVSTAPNAVIRDIGHVRPLQFLKAGIGANVITLLVTYVSDLTYVNLILKTSTFPKWAAANLTNATR